MRGKERKKNDIYTPGYVSYYRLPYMMDHLFKNKNSRFADIFGTKLRI